VAGDLSSHHGRTPAEHVFLLLNYAVMRRYPVLLLLVVGMAFVLAACGDAREPAEEVERPSPATGMEPEPGLADVPSAPLYEASREVEAPDFELATLDHGTFRLSEHRGSVVVVNFWATWCPPCLHEIPDFIALQDELGEAGLVIAGVSLDDEGVEVVERYARELEINYPIMLDDGQAAELYGPIDAMPTTFLIDRKGMVRSYAPGMLTRDALRPVLQDLLAERG
jgi:peroxiredoxin